MNNTSTLQIVALDVGGTKIAGALVSYSLRVAHMAGNIPMLESTEPQVEQYATIPTSPERGGEAVLESIQCFCRDLLALADGPVAGIGVAAAGVIDPVTGCVAFANDSMPSWTGQPVRERLEQAFGFSVAVLGDVQSHALGEARFGAAQGMHSCLCVGIGTGIGGALVVEGKVLRGFHGAAGHIGHSFHPKAAGIPCACGHPSHIESIASGTAIAARYQGCSSLDTLDSSQMGDYVAARAAEGEAKAIEVLEFAGRTLGEAIGTWCNIFDPEVVVLSGTVCQAGRKWRTALEAGFTSQAFELLASIPLVYGSLGSYAPLVGAAENLVDELVRKGVLAR